MTWKVSESRHFITLSYRILAPRKLFTKPWHKDMTGGCRGSGPPLLTWPGWTIQGLPTEYVMERKFWSDFSQGISSDRSHLEEEKPFTLQVVFLTKSRLHQVCLTLSSRKQWGELGTWRMHGVWLKTTALREKALPFTYSWCCFHISPIARDLSGKACDGWVV